MLRNFAELEENLKSLMPNYFSSKLSCSFFRFSSFVCTKTTCDFTPSGSPKIRSSSLVRVFSPRKIFETWKKSLGCIMVSSHFEGSILRPRFICLYGGFGGWGILPRFRFCHLEVHCRGKIQPRLTSYLSGHLVRSSIFLIRQICSTKRSLRVNQPVTFVGGNVGDKLFNSLIKVWLISG